MTPPPDHEEAVTSSPRLLFVGEFPPSNHHGGAILLKRLLAQHPSNCLTVITSKQGMTASQPTGLLDCPHIALSSFSSLSPWTRPLARAANLFALALVALRTMIEIRRKRVQSLITVVQGRYYLAAALAAWITATPHVTIVHDNFVDATAIPLSATRRIMRRLTRKILLNASHVYAVSPEMQRLVFRECGVESEIQLPSTEAPARLPRSDAASPRQSGPVILFAGTIGYTVRDCLDLLVNLIASGKLENYGVPGVRLHLCANVTDAEKRSYGWDNANVVCRGWVPQSGLANALSDADILFLPYSFSEPARDAVETAFPSKTADYLAAGKPILIFGPEYSSLVRYASEQGFAEIVNQSSPEALAAGIAKIALSPVYQAKLANRALEVFSANHDIERQRRKFYLMLKKIISGEQEPASVMP
ncbi:MAG: glycosyltransferase [Candidatus Sulfotelmatobacter sp.]